VERRMIGAHHEGNAEFRFAICPRCCFVYMSPKMIDEAAARYYADDFHQNKGFGRLELGRLGSVLGILKPLKRHLAQRSNAALAEKQIRIFERLRTELSVRADLRPGSLVVDVGCAWGVLARLIHDEFGCEVYGVEPSRAAAHYARAQGVEIVASTAEEMGQVAALQRRVDLVMFHTSLLNVNDIEIAMDQTRKLLKPTGLLYIKTRNYLWNNRMAKFNNYAFLPENLRYFLERNGFNVLSMDHAPRPSAADSFAKSYRFMSVWARRDKNVAATLPTLDCDQVLAEGRDGKERALAAEAV
jgi:2-polyprenyl-3-methyl-5-hydroxy-6-metoxy-1,4-benzoquinol methylase